MVDKQSLSTDAPVTEVAELWKSVLKRKDVPHDVPFPELGGDSLLLIALLTEIEDEFDVYLEAEDILDDLTVDGIARVIARKRASA
ncbi:acyl carrier protein [Streptomyces macrosporus]|uniref:Carrier domain-containing protein n=1 Tax=Streptomyces macrosporus TaxID=44032 RepID=A0ABN3JFR2_9ACTN